MSSISIIQAESLFHIDPKHGVILDVRSDMEHADKHIGFGHAHVPLDKLNPTDFMTRLGLDHDAEVYILCRSGGRAMQAAETFVKEGYRNVKVVEGGLVACEDCGHPLQGHGVLTGDRSSSSRRPLSLERQVRISAGLFVALGTHRKCWTYLV